MRRPAENRCFHGEQRRSSGHFRIETASEPASVEQDRFLRHPVKPRALSEPQRSCDFRLPGKGEAGVRGGTPGDLFVICRVEESPVFRRRGDNFEVEVPITVAEAIRGADVEVPTLHGSKKLRVAGGTKHGTLQRLKGEGPPVLGGRGRGDMHYRFVIDVPKDLSREQQDAVDELSKVMYGNPREDLLRQAKGDAA